MARSLIVNADYATPERDGISGVFLIAALQDENGNDISEMVDQAMRFSSTGQCTAYLQKTFGQMIDVQFLVEFAD